MERKGQVKPDTRQINTVLHFLGGYTYGNYLKEKV